MERATEKTTALTDLATLIRHEREMHGHTQDSIAAFAGVSRQLYAGIESGLRPLPVHRAAEYGECVVLAAIKHLLSQLKTTRLELVQASDDRLCAESYATLSTLVSRSSQVCQVMAEALADGVVSDDELDTLEEKAAEAEETFRRLRRDIAVKRELCKQARKAPGLVKTRTGSGIQAKAVQR